jgi:hypothetical protein
VNFLRLNVENRGAIGHCLPYMGMAGPGVWFIEQRIFGSVTEKGITRCDEQQGKMG